MTDPSTKQLLYNLLAYLLESERDCRYRGSIWCQAIRLAYDLGRTDSDFFALWNQYKTGSSTLSLEVAFLLRSYFAP